MKKILILLALAMFGQSTKAQNEPKLVIQAAPNQTNDKPLIKLQNSGGNDLMWIHSDDGSNVFIGTLVAKDNDDGSGNAGIGAKTLYSNIHGSGNIAIGTESLFSNTDGNDNIGVGGSSLRANKGGRNVGLGAFALSKNVAGNYNIAMGFGAMSETTGSEYNTALGYRAGATFNNGYNNVFVGANTDVDAPDYYNVVAIGQGTVVDDVNRVRIGNTATTSYGGWAGWTSISDGRYKTGVKENVPGLDFIMQLRPVTYHLEATSLSKALHENHGLDWDDQMKISLCEKEKMVQTGFIAQEVEAAAQSIGYDFSGIDRPKNEQGTYGLRYAEFVMPLVKSVQELKNENERLKAENGQLRKAEELLARRLSQIEAALGLLEELAGLSKE